MMCSLVVGCVVRVGLGAVCDALREILIFARAVLAEGVEVAVRQVVVLRVALRALERGVAATTHECGDKQDGNESDEAPVVSIHKNSLILRNSLQGVRRYESIVHTITITRGSNARA